jgi:Ca-activated chloride channel family protein
MNILKFEGWDLFFVHIPGWVILLAGGLIVLLLIWHYLRRMPRQSATVRYSDLSLVRKGKKTLRQRLRPALFALRVLAVSVLFVALARPQSGEEQRDIETEGIDIMLVLDVSSSMKAEDFKPHNRLFVAKEEIGKFIDRRTNDRIGLTVFAKSSFTQCPLTLDYGVLKSFLDQVDFGIVDGDMTAIGAALANAVNRLRNSNGKSKVIVILTDGENNVWEIDPITAANIAKTMGVKIYTIGAGKPGNAMYPVDDPLFGKRYVYVPTEIDEESLKKIADITGGKYFRARSENELDQIYSEIDQMEKTKIQVHEYIQYRELFFDFLMLGFGLFLAEVVLGQTYMRKIP